MSGAKFCEGCGKQASSTARFCGACGAAFAEPPGDEPTEPTPGPGPHDGLPGEPPQKGERVLFDMHPLAIQSFVEIVLVFATLGIVWAILWFRRIDTRYRITNQRIEITSGVFSKRRQTIELFRVQDYELEEPLFLRLRSAGNLIVRSMDPGEPEVVLTGLPDAQLVFETMRKISIDERQRHRVRLLEGM